MDERKEAEELAKHIKKNNIDIENPFGFIAGYIIGKNLKFDNDVEMIIFSVELNKYLDGFNKGNENKRRD